jgi:hypothetical protein
MLRVHKVRSKLGGKEDLMPVFNESDDLGKTERGWNGEL